MPYADQMRNQLLGSMGQRQGYGLLPWRRGAAPPLQTAEQQGWNGQLQAQAPTIQGQLGTAYTQSLANYAPKGSADRPMLGAQGYGQMLNTPLGGAGYGGGPASQEQLNQEAIWRQTQANQMQRQANNAAILNQGSANFQAAQLAGGSQEDLNALALANQEQANQLALTDQESTQAEWLTNRGGGGYGRGGWGGYGGGYGNPYGDQGFGWGNVYDRLLNQPLGYGY